MMQGLALAADAPLYGRASEMLELAPLEPPYLAQAFDSEDRLEQVELYAAWGGIPRYWELAKEVEGGVLAQVDRLALDPLGPLHREPDRLLLEELPPAVETRPVLDAIGAGAHRVSEIAGRLGRPATSMARPLERLVAMALVRREVPFGEFAKTSRRSLYKIDDPFIRLWFRVVAPHRGLLAAPARGGRASTSSGGTGAPWRPRRGRSCAGDGFRSCRRRTRWPRPARGSRRPGGGAATSPSGPW